MYSTFPYISNSFYNRWFVTQFSENFMRYCNTNQEDTPHLGNLCKMFRMYVIRNITVAAVIFLFLLLFLFFLQKYVCKCNDLLKYLSLLKSTHWMWSIKTENFVEVLTILINPTWLGYSSSSFLGSSDFSLFPASPFSAIASFDFASPSLGGTLTTTSSATCVSSFPGGERAEEGKNDMLVSLTFLRMKLSVEELKDHLHWKKYCYDLW